MAASQASSYVASLAAAVTSLQSQPQIHCSSTSRPRRQRSTSNSSPLRTPSSSFCGQLCRLVDNYSIARECARPASVVCAVASSGESATTDAPSQAPLVSTSLIWELDFCSRPITDERGKKVTIRSMANRNCRQPAHTPMSSILCFRKKKAIFSWIQAWLICTELCFLVQVWELLICDPERRFVYSEYFPNNRINSTSLREALNRILEQEGVARPQKVRFFRYAPFRCCTYNCCGFLLKPRKS